MRGSRRLPLLTAGFQGQVATFPGVLRCVTPAEYWFWQGRPGDEAPDEIRDPLRRFCYDADSSWCREQRAAGCCHLTDEQFQVVLNEQRRENQEDEASTMTTTTTNGRATAAWEVWTGGTADQVIAIERTGQMRVNQSADVALGKPSAIQLLYNVAKQQIGVKACADSADGAIRLRRRENQVGFSFAASAFLRHYDVPFSETRRWPVSQVEGVLVIDLTGRPLAATRRGQKVAA